MIKKTRSAQQSYDILAGGYNPLRKTDEEPIYEIKKWLRPGLSAADIGCGGGRYSRLLIEHGITDHLICMDRNKSMLREAHTYMNAYQRGFSLIQGVAETLPFQRNSIGVLFGFNTIHLFDFDPFIRSAAEVLKPEGYLFLYTRTPAQNQQSIWGQYFPSFSEKETRLYQREELISRLRSFPSFETLEFISFTYKRNHSLSELLDLVDRPHYSTFLFYTQSELEEAKRIFEERIRNEYSDVNSIEWKAGNLLVVIKKKK